MPDWDPELESHIEGNLATEVAMIVLDTLAVVEQVVAAADHSQTLLASVLRVMLHALNTNQVPTVYIFESNQTPFTVNQLSSTPVCCPAISCFKVGLTIFFCLYQSIHELGKSKLVC